MAKVAEHLDSVQAKPPGSGHWSGYVRRREDPRGAEVLEGASSDKELVAGLCLFKGIANLLDALFVRNASITCAKLQKEEETLYREFGETLKGNLECNAYNVDAKIPTVFSAKVMDRVIQFDKRDCFISADASQGSHGCIAADAG